MPSIHCALPCIAHSAGVVTEKGLQICRKLLKLLHIETPDARSFSVCFVQEFWPKLCSSEKAQAMLDVMQTQQHQLAQDFEAESAELSLLQAHVVESACDDPGALLLPHLILPYLRKRLEAEAAQFDAATDAGSASYSRVSVTRPLDNFQLITAP